MGLPVQHLSRLIYRSIQATTQGVGAGLDWLLGVADFSGSVNRMSSPEREAWLSILNGVVGDHLSGTNNPLAIPISLRYRGQPLALISESLRRDCPDARCKLLITAHGLCLNDRHWSPAANGAAANGATACGPGLPDQLAAELGYSAIHLYYNTGRHIGDNGSDFAALLEQLVAQWPQPVDELILLGHSMGGLVARSAVLEGAAAGHDWARRPLQVICLGTPHQGAPLEQLGQQLDRMLEISRYSAPFARLGRIRSAGISDLGHGRLRPDVQENSSQWPQAVPIHNIAGLLHDPARKTLSETLGDGLVPLPSALNQPSNRKRCDEPVAGHQYIAGNTGHLSLLTSPQVREVIRQWLS
ncbi:MAG: permease [Wenzhouxiangellaceae bacterium]